MSLILEALRKSEAERLRGQAPGLHVESAPATPAHARAVPPWPWIALAVAVALLALWLLRPATPEQRAAGSARANAPAAAMAAEPRLPAVRRLVAPAAPPVAQAPQPPPPQAVAATPRETASPEPMGPAQPIAPVAPVRAAEAAPAPASTDDGDATPLSGLAPDARKALPPLRLSMHMWNDDPARRFVIVDGNRLGEGDRIGDMVVSAITRDGVVLDWNGRRLKLPIR